MYNGQSSWGGSESGICWLERWTDVSDELWFEFPTTRSVMVLVSGQSELCAMPLRPLDSKSELDSPICFQLPRKKCIAP